MDFGELVSVSIDFVGHNDCYFCNAKDNPPKEEKNEFETSPDEDEDLDGASFETFRAKNCSKKLGDNLGGTPANRDATLGDGKAYASSVAAHHLIPGNAALKKSTLFKAGTYLRVDGMATGNIGYDMNGFPNGVWLPGNYAQRPWGSGGSAFQATTKRSPQEYAFGAIRAWRAQFHDAHEDYSDFVRGRLDELKQKLDKGETAWCPESKNRDDEEGARNLYDLVNRLDSLSGRMRTMLVFPTSSWKKNIFTSRFGPEYMADAKGFEI